MNIIKFHNPGVLVDRLPDHIFQKVKEEIKEKRKNKINFDNRRKNSLQILSIKEIDDTPYIEEFSLYILNMFKVWCEQFEIPFDFNNQKVEIGHVWTNHMRCGEFAPAHKHIPSFAAFVLWIQIPYLTEEEKRVHYEQGKIDHTNRNGAFEFIYSKLNGELEVHRMALDKKDEGTIIMFPSNMIHLVYPFFSSDQERISIAGNIYV